MNQEELNKIERKRKTIYSTILTLNIVIVILFIGIIISLAVSFTSLDISSPNFEKFLIIPFITIALIVILIFVNGYIKNLINLISKEISKTIYEPVFKEKNTEFSYDDGLTLDEVMSSELLPPPDDFASSSLTKGEILGFSYKASNITLWEEREERDSKGRTYRTKVIIFDGRMYIIETPFNKKGIILKSKKIEEGKLLDIAVSVIIILIAIGLVTHNLLPMLSDPYFKKEVVEFFKENLPFFIGFALIIILTIISSILSNREKEYQEAQLESSQFNEYFDIKTQDQVELRKTLTPAVMEKLINLRNSIGEFHLSIIGNKIFFAFPKSLAIKYNKPIQELIQEAKESVDKEIETIKSIIETLKLEEEKIKKGMIS